MTGSLIAFLTFFPMVAVCPLYALRRRSRELRNRYILTVPAVELAAALALVLCPGTAELPGVCGLGLRFAAGGFQTFLAVLTAFLWMMTGLTCREYFSGAERTNRFYLYWLLTLGALMGVFLSDDFFTLFIFFEIMSFTSWVWVAFSETPGALRAARTYLAVAVFGGMLLLTGLLLLWNLFGTLRYTEVETLARQAAPEHRGVLLTAGFLCLTGFGAKAGLYPLHIWLPKAHPVAPAPASALLSGILTKSGVFGVVLVARYLLPMDGVFRTALLALAVVTMTLGALLALFSTDLKRTLACSSMSQIGFILLGVALQNFLQGENTLAVWGTVLHLLNHSLIKLVLFVCAGVIYLSCHHRLELDDIRGVGRRRPILRGAFFIAAASLAGVPGFSGYISKTLLHESIVESIHVLAAAGGSTAAMRAVEWLFLISGGLTAAYMTKLFVCIFGEPRPGDAQPGTREGVDGPTAAALTVTAAVLAVLGLTPGVTMQGLAQACGGFFRAAGEIHAVPYFSPENLRGAGISLAIGAAIYFGVVRTALRTVRDGEICYPNRWPEKLDLETLVYRPALRAASFFGALCARAAASLGDLTVLAGEKLLFLRAPGIFVPKRTENFGAYGKKPRRILIAETFSFELLIAGIGLIAALLYILLN